MSPGLPKTSTSTRIAFVGDVHDLWDPRDDTEALGCLRADMTVFVGDIGNENLDLVQQIAAGQHRKLVMLGNHDAWSCLHGNWQRLVWDGANGAPDPGAAVKQQLQCLGDAALGWNRHVIEGHPVSIVGARPFSKGGKWPADFYRHIFGVQSPSESAAKIAAAAASAPEDHAVVVVGHNGPAGLGTAGWDICGVDFRPGFGDHGDADLAEALADVRARGRRVELVAFGHMHHRLHPSAVANPANPDRRSLRKMVVHREGTWYVNVAVVPRIEPHAVVGGQRSYKRHFVVVDIGGGGVERIQHVWVSIAPDTRETSIVHVKDMMRAVPDEGLQVWDDSTGTWLPADESRTDPVAAVP